ncbi:MAG: YIP1 family protein [Anaerolineae bacterium]|nr:YIP1 family protein [Anaerolineae bacterium]
MKRIIGAFTFRKEVYAEVERDIEFTTTAWVLVAVVSLISQLGRLPTYGFENIGSWLISSLVTVVFAVGGFALGAFIMSWAGKQFFKAEVDFGEMVRVLGLAYVWNIVGVIGILGFIPVLVCILSPITIVALIAGFVAWLFAAKEALDLDWVPTIITVVIGWVISFIVGAIAGFILTALGIGAVAIAGSM